MVSLNGFHKDSVDCFVNISNIITYTIWTNSMKELENLCESLEKEPTTASVVPNVLYTGYIFDTWQDKLVEKR